MEWLDFTTFSRTKEEAVNKTKETGIVLHEWSLDHPVCRIARFGVQQEADE